MRSVCGQLLWGWRPCFSGAAQCWWDDGETQATQHWFNPQEKQHVHITWWCLLTLVYLSLLVMSDSLWPRGLQHIRLPCPSPTPGACSNSCPSSSWCLCLRITTSSSVVFSCLQSFPASCSFPRSQLFASDGQSIEASASASALPMNIQNWFPQRISNSCIKGVWVTALLNLFAAGAEQ